MAEGQKKIHPKMPMFNIVIHLYRQMTGDSGINHWCCHLDELLSLNSEHVFSGRMPHAQ